MEAFIGYGTWLLNWLRAPPAHQSDSSQAPAPTVDETPPPAEATRDTTIKVPSTTTSTTPMKTDQAPSKDSDGHVHSVTPNEPAPSYPSSMPATSAPESVPPPYEKQSSHGEELRLARGKSSTPIPRATQTRQSALTVDAGTSRSYGIQAQYQESSMIAVEEPTRAGPSVLAGAYGVIFDHASLGGGGLAAVGGDQNHGIVVDEELPVAVRPAQTTQSIAIVEAPRNDVHDQGIARAPLLNERPVNTPTYGGPSVLRGASGVVFSGGMIDGGALAAVGGDQNFGSPARGNTGVRRTNKGTAIRRAQPSVLQDARDVRFVGGRVAGGALAAVGGDQNFSAEAAGLTKRKEARRN